MLTVLAAILTEVVSRCLRVTYIFLPRRIPQFEACGSGTGNGGTISVSAAWSNPQLGWATVKCPSKQASGSAGGDGALCRLMRLQCGGDLGMVNAGAIDVSALANGNGGNVKPFWGDGVNGTLDVSGAVQRRRRFGFHLRCAKTLT